MPNFKPVVRKDYTSQSGKARIYISYFFKGKRRLHKTDLFVEPEFMAKNGRIKTNHPLAPSLNIALNREVIRCDDIFLRNSPKTIEQLEYLLKGKNSSGIDFYQHLYNMVADMNKNKRYSSAGVYEAVAESLKEFTGKDKLSFGDIGSDFLDRYRTHMLFKDKSVNTVIEYIKKINAVINHAASKKLVDLRDLPSRKIKIKSAKSSVRLLDVDDLRKMLFRPYPSPSMQEAVDCFFLSFYLMGVNLKDICYATEEDIYKGRWLYNRAKTGNVVSSKVPDVAWEIINRHKGKKYLLDFIEKDDSFTGYRIFSNKVNYYLELIATMIGLDVNLTQKYARKSWATIASSKSIGTTLEVIDKAQGRRSGEINTRYVKYDLDRIDEVNEKVIKLLFSY